ncbi:MAG: IPTL-CTERM sorting domain-containing protein [Burkholderiales bacterium]|nr:IPTL-CTERM sorting domain-containing protein [Burkholderiales bacterium]
MLLIPGMARAVDNVPYLVPGIANVQYANGVTEIATDADLPATLTAGWYITTCAAGDIIHNETVTVNGAVNLILGDGCTLTVNGHHGFVGGGSISLRGGAGINVSAGQNLTIYAQSSGGSMGGLTANGGFSVAGGGGAGIGTGDSEFLISDSVVGAITINGGLIKAAGAEGSAGIGSGILWSCGAFVNGGIVTINGGDVTATGGASGAGIGGGWGGSGDIIAITGGVVHAYGGSQPNSYGGGAGIGGGGSSGDGITFGSTYCNGSDGGASGNITISGDAAVYAYGGFGGVGGGGAGIGSGGTDNTGQPGGALGTIVIQDTNANVKAAVGGMGDTGTGANIGMGAGGPNGSGSGVETTFYTVTASVNGTGGSIAASPPAPSPSANIVPAGSWQVSNGSTMNFDIIVTPDNGYAVTSLTVTPAGGASTDVGALRYYALTATNSISAVAAFGITGTSLTTAIPTLNPAALVLLAMGLAGLAIQQRRRRR